MILEPTRYRLSQAPAFGVCAGLCREVFELPDDGYAVVRVIEVPPELEEAVHQAVRQCP